MITKAHSGLNSIVSQVPDMAETLCRKGFGEMQKNVKAI